MVKSLRDRILEALKKEMAYYKDRFECFDSLYLGGGTPTLLSARDLQKIMQHLFTHFDFAPNTEFTIEANPGGSDPGKGRQTQGHGL